LLAATAAAAAGGGRRRRAKRAADSKEAVEHAQRLPQPDDVSLLEPCGEPLEVRLELVSRERERPVGRRHRVEAKDGVDQVVGLVDDEDGVLEVELERLAGRGVEDEVVRQRNDLARGRRLWA